MEITRPMVGYSGNIPETYDKHLGQLLLEPFAEDMAARAASAKPQKVLEIACGTGRVTRHLIDLLADSASITATDINPDMMAYAKENLAGAAAIQWQVADAHKLPFDDNCFDIVVCQLGVMFFERRVAAYAEILRVLKPGGQFVCNTWDGFENNPPVAITQQVLAAYFPSDIPGFYRVPFGYHDEHTILRELSAGGFSDIKMETVRKKGYSPFVEDAATGLLEGTPVHTQIVQRDAAMLPVVKAELAKRLAQQFGNSHIAPPLQVKVMAAAKSM